MSELEMYASLKVSDDKYLVTCAVEKKSASLLPKSRRLNGLPCAHTGHAMREHYNGWDGFTMYDALIFWWSIKLYASSKVSVGKEVEEMNS
eukprot:6344502-Ditylum_brightwellii.AAC.1